jgi:hypothetical protein
MFIVSNGNDLMPTQLLAIENKYQQQSYLNIFIAYI